MSTDAPCITVMHTLHTSFFTVNWELINQDRLTSSLLFPCRWLGGAAVTVHSGLQGDVQAFTRGTAEERLGCVRGAHTWRRQRRCATASEGSHIWIQSPPLLQRIPRSRQRCQNWQDARRRWEGGGLGWMHAAVRVSSLWSLRVCMHVFMFTQFYMHNSHVWALTTAVYSRQWGQDYVMFKCGVFTSMLGCMFSSLKAPMEPCTTPESKC